MSTTADFSSIDFGVSQEHPTIMQTVNVAVKRSSILSDFAKGFTNEAFRLNYDKAKSTGFEVQENEDFFWYLCTKRDEVVHGSCSDFRNLKMLYIPAYLQWIMHLYGICVDRPNGLTFVPHLEEPSTMTFAEAVIVSEKIASFEKELQIVQDAMPREISGDLNYMSTVLIGDVVKACREVNPVITYCTAFMDMKLQEEATYAILYRKEYGDRTTIAQALYANGKKLY